MSSLAEEVRDAVAGQTIPAEFQRMVEQRGGAAALQYRIGSKWTPISWTDYGLAVGRFANLLLSHDLQPGERVAIWAGNRPEWQIADLGVLHVGGATVAVYQTLAASQVEYQLRHSESRVLVVENRKYLDQIAQARASLPDLRLVVLLDEDGDDTGVVTWKDGLAQGEAFGRSRPGLFLARWQAVRPEDMASLIYTSGTTGTPKAAIISHTNLTWAVEMTVRIVPVHPEDRMLSFLPLAHILERIASHLRQVRGGSQVFFCPSIEQLEGALRDVRPTFFVAVPRLWEKMHARVRAQMDKVTGPGRILRDFALHVAQRLSEAHERRQEPGPLLRGERWVADRFVFRRVRRALGLDHCRFCGSVAAAISPDILRFFYGLGIEIVELYGMTEAPPITTNLPGQSRFGTVGRALEGIDIRLADDGEILVRGPNVFQGYLKDPASTAEALIDGWLYTGDIGQLDTDGFLTITDRKKDLFKTSGGKYVAPGAVENLLKNERGISQAVILGDNRAYVAALLTLDPDVVGRGAKPTDSVARKLAEDAVGRVNQRLSHPEQIKRWCILERDFGVGEELTPTLKIKRKVIAEKYKVEIEDLYRRPA
jgi:long-chain acyl-CoA synthetase